MESIELEYIKKERNRVTYHFVVSEQLKPFFESNLDFIIEYNESIEEVPDGILAVPFVGVMLPISWMTDSNLIIDTLDKDFYHSIPEFENGYIEMFPDADFKGGLSVNHIAECRPTNKTGISGAFFSGGLDATTTLLRHIDEKPFLITIWGADVGFNNRDAWKIVWEGTKETAQAYGLNCTYIRTAFHEFNNDMLLKETFMPVLHTGWWYAFAHGVGLITQAAPIAYLHNISTLYMASSNCPEDGPQSCASDPRTDNFIKYGGCSIVHDAFELNRQKKAAFIVDSKRKRPNLPVKLRVCYKSVDGDNCCHCEKCYRTMTNLWIEGEDPRDYGFNYPDDVFVRMREYITLHCESMASKSWTYAKNRLKENWEGLREKPWRDELQWILDFDFINLESNQCRIQYRKSWKLKGMLVKRFPHLYQLYVKLRGYSYAE